MIIGLLSPEEPAGNFQEETVPSTARNSTSKTRPSVQSGVYCPISCSSLTRPARVAARILLS